jgi:L-ascorbate metabolism protein UlaG (beta-lactamase superfamily)
VLGFKTQKLEADIVTVSHDHSDHNNVEATKKGPKEYRELDVDSTNLKEVAEIAVLQAN